MTIGEHWTIRKYESNYINMFQQIILNVRNLICYNIHDLPGSIYASQHWVTMDGHRQGKKANAWKYPLKFFKRWSSSPLSAFTDPTAKISSSNLFHSLQTRLANLGGSSVRLVLWLELAPIVTEQIDLLNRIMFFFLFDHLVRQRRILHWVQILLHTFLHFVHFSTLEWMPKLKFKI